MKVGEKLKLLRTEKGMSQKRLGDLVGLSPSSIQSYEIGRTKPKKYILISIADALGICPEIFNPKSSDVDDLMKSAFENYSFDGACEKINEYYNYTPVNQKSKPITGYPEELNNHSGEPDQRSILDKIIYPTEPNVRDSGRQEYLSILTGFMNNLNMTGLRKVDYFIAELLKDNRYITTDFYELMKRLGENRNAVVHELEPESDADEPDE